MKSIYIEEVCRILNAENSRVLELAQTGQLPGAKIGRSWVFLEDMVYEYLLKVISEQTACRSNKRKISKILSENVGIDPTLVGAEYTKKRKGRTRRASPELFC